MTIALALACVGVLSALWDQTFEQFYSGFSAAREGIHSLEANFTQKTVTPDEVMTSIGTLFYGEPRRIVFRYQDPELVYMIDGNHAYEYDAELQQLERYELGDLPQAEAFFLGFNSDPGRLQEAYRVYLARPKEGIGAIVALQIEPKPRGDEAPLFERLTLQLRAEDFLPIEIHIRNDDDSDVLYTVDGFVLNGTTGPERTQIFLPEGTDVIYEEEFVERIGPGGRYVPEPLAVTSVKVSETSLPDGVEGESKP